jgi:hypothetical protein
MDLITIGTGPRKLWLIGRQHPGETMASYFFGITFLLQNSIEIPSRRHSCALSLCIDPPCIHSFVCQTEGFLARLLDVTDSACVKLLEDATIYCVPNMNPVRLIIIVICVPFFNIQPLHSRCFPWDLDNIVTNSIGREREGPPAH